MEKSTVNRGASAEADATGALLAAGYQIVERNFACNDVAKQLAAIGRAWTWSTVVNRASGSFKPGATEGKAGRGSFSNNQTEFLRRFYFLGLKYGVVVKGARAA